MKYTAIPGIKKTVCTAEQKIAANLAVRYRSYIKSAYDSAASGIQKSEIIRAAVRGLCNSFSRDYPNTKYNLDAIFCALGAGLEDFIKGSTIFFSSFEEVGAAFPALYL